MHSFTTKTALAALLISTAFAGAQAAQSNTTSVSGSGFGRQERDTAMKHDRGDLPDEFSGNMQGYSPAVARGTTHRMESPRLARIVSELNAADRRIDMDHRRGHLTAAETSRLRNEAGMIRRSAHAMANRHGGKLTNASYEELQRQVRTLDRSIHRSSRT